MAAAAAHTRLLRLGRQLQAASSNAASTLTKTKPPTRAASLNFLGSGEAGDVSDDLSSSPSSATVVPDSAKQHENSRGRRSEEPQTAGPTKVPEERKEAESSKPTSSHQNGGTSFSPPRLFATGEARKLHSSLSVPPPNRTTRTAADIASESGGGHTLDTSLTQNRVYQPFSTLSRPESVETTARHSNSVRPSSSNPSSFFQTSASVSPFSPAKPPPFASRFSFSQNYGSSSTRPATSLPGPGAVWSSDLLVEHSEKTPDGGDKSGCVVLRLNRPERLNALSLDLITALRWIIPALEGDPRCSVLCVAGQGPKAFCAGGDVKSLVGAPLIQIQQFFGQEYSLIYFLSQMAKPYIALWDGISMGGGVGLSMCMKYRVCFDTTVWAMPETAIGLYPDVGAAYFLNQLPPHLEGVGLYLGLTGTRLKAADLVKTGLATHYVPSSKRKECLKALMEIEGGLTPAEAHAEVQRVLGEFHDERPLDSDPSLTALSPSVIEGCSRYFSSPGPCFKELFAELEKGASAGHPFCAETVKKVRELCPLSCAVWYEFYRRAMRKKEKVGDERSGGETAEAKEKSSPSLLDVLRKDYKLIQAFVAFHPENYNEGIRAALIDKDRRPKWVPPRIEDLKWKDISRMVDCHEDTGSLDRFIFP